MKAKTEIVNFDRSSYSRSLASLEAAAETINAYMNSCYSRKSIGRLYEAKETDLLKFLFSPMFTDAAPAEVEKFASDNQKQIVKSLQIVLQSYPKTYFMQSAGTVQVSKTAEEAAKKTAEERTAKEWTTEYIKILEAIEALYTAAQNGTFSGNRAGAVQLVKKVLPKDGTITKETRKLIASQLRQNYELHRKK